MLVFERGSMVIRQVTDDGRAPAVCRLCLRVSEHENSVNFIPPHPST